MKLIRCETDENGKTIAVIKTKGGKEYIGLATLHPDDKDNASQFAGGYIAETRAIIKALKEKRQIEKKKCEACRKFINACKCHKDFDADSPTAKIMHKELKTRIAIVDDITTLINSMLLSLKEYTISRDEILKYLKKSKKVNEPS